MNKQRYRIIFNAARGIMMAVAEFVKSHISAEVPTAKTQSDITLIKSQSSLSVALRPLAFSLMCVLGLVTIIPNPLSIESAYAEAKAAGNVPGNQRPNVLSAPNGVEVVNIQTPSAAGVSHNIYEILNVPEQGMIFNNSSNNVQTELGGWIQGNPWLANGTARIILNEINSSHPSYLNGYMEIAGNRAELIIANPNGISCNGCGFINASRGVLTTGVPILAGGDLSGYRVTGGAVNIWGNGLDATRSNYTDIIARAVEVNAGIWANDLKITTGANSVNASNTQVAAITGSGNAPTFALDVAALGGMYAQKITMIGTEDGLGVRNAGVMYAYAGSLSLDINGNLSNSNLIAGTTLAKIQAEDIQNTSASIVSTELLEINANSLSGDGKVLAGGHSTITLQDDYIHQAVGELQANGNLTFTTAGQLINQGQLLSGQTLTLNAQSIHNVVSAEILGLHTHLNAENDITNRGLIDGGDTFIVADIVNNIGTGTIYGDHVAIAAGTLNNLDETLIDPSNGTITNNVALIAARARLDVGATDILNRYDSQLFSAGDMSIRGSLDADHKAIGTAKTLMNDGGIIEALGSLHIAADDIQNLNSNLTTQEVLIATENIDRFRPRFTSVVWDSSDYPGARIGDVTISTRTAGPYSFREYHRYLATARTYETQIVTTNPGQILAGGDMAIAGNVLNRDSEIIAGGNLNLTAAVVDNQNTQGQLVKKYSNKSGQGTFYYDYDGSGSGFSYDIDYLGPYRPADEVTTFNLPTSRILGQTLFTGNGTQVATLTPVSIPNSHLYHVNPDTTAHYLIVTDPRFANYRIWLGSDYLLRALGYDPATVTKRLGDGFYEQRLIREQIGQLTGRRFLTGFANDEAQYQALMSNGATFAQAHQLIPGVALTEAQVAQLTSDIVWLVEQTITLTDGTTAQALVPQVYIRLQPGDLNAHGALLAGETVHLNLDGDLINSGTIAGRTLTSISADNIHNLGGLISGNVTALNATQDINNVGGSIQAQNALILQAGHDINITSTTQSNQNTAGASSFTRTNLDRIASLYVSDPNGILVAAANNNINLNAAYISNSGENGTTIIDAGNDLNLNTVTTAEQNNIIKNHKNFIKYGNTQEIGTVIQTQGDLSLNAGHDLSAEAANVTSEQGTLNASAGNNLTIESGTTSSNLAAARTTKKRGTFSRKRTEHLDTFNDSEVISSTFSGNEVNLNAGNDITVTGSNVVGTQDVNLNAGNNITIQSAQATHDETHYARERRSGFSVSSTSIGYGSSSLQTTNNTQQVMHVGSTVGSVQGNVNINAGEQYAQTASDVVTPSGDINITAQQVDINAATNTYANQQSMEYEQTGITIGVGSSALNLAQNVLNTTEAAVQSDSNRNKALNALQTYANGSTLVDQGSTLAGAINAGNLQDAASASGASISISVGTSSAESSSTTNITSQQISLIKSGGDITINATERDVNITGSEISADNNLTLAAAQNINLIASSDYQTNQSDNESSSTSIGLSVGVGAGGTGFSVGLAASRGQGDANSDSVTYNNTHVTAGETLTLNSGNDTNLIGANVAGNQVVANVGGNLNVQSLQDAAVSHAEQSNTGISISVPIGAGTPGGSFSQSAQNSNSNYASVYEQSSMFAGEGGFNISVQDNTNLVGAIITSAASAEHNQLTTGTLTTRDIQNHMEAEADSSGTTLNTKILDGKYEAAKVIAGNLQNHGEEHISASSTTYSAISSATITITDEVQQQTLTGATAEETVATLNRDTSNTNLVLIQPDMQALQEQAQQEQANRMLLVNTSLILADKINRSMTANKKILLQKCGLTRQDCTTTEVSVKDLVIVNGKVYVFNHGIFNDEEYALANAAKQASDEQNAQGVYVIINPYTGDAISEVLYAGWDKLNELLGGILPISNASEANIEIRDFIQNINQERLAQGLPIIVIEEIDHSRGSLTSSNATATQFNNSQTEVPLGSVTFNGAAANAQNMSDMVNTVTNGQGIVQQSSHVDDWVGTAIGSNPATGGIEGTGIGSHSTYTGTHSNVLSEQEKTDEYWGAGNVSIPVIVLPNSPAGGLR